MSEMQTVDKDASPQIEDLSDKLVHILLPRNCRNGIVISVPSHIPYETMCSSILSSLQNTMESSYIEILNISVLESEIDDPDKTIYRVTFLKIPNVLISKLIESGIKKCIFYVGLIENNKEFPVLDGAPPINKLATTNREGVPTKYNSNIVTLE